MNLPEVQLQYRLIHDVYVLLDNGDSAVLRQFGLTATQMSVLRQLEQGEGCRLTTLSKRVMRSKSAITRIIDSLEEKGLVARVGDPDDRRAQRVVLTGEGREFRDGVSRQHLQSLAQRFEVLEEGEQQALTGLLKKLREGLAAQLRE